MLKITLAAARVNAKLAQKDVSRMMGVSRNTVSAWEKGKKSPRPAEFMMLCRIYKISEDFVIMPED